MKIVVLDGYTLNPGDLSWDGFKKLGELVVYDRTPPEKVVERATDAEAVLTNKTRLNREIIRKLQALKYIGVLATGYDVVNIQDAAKRGVIVTNIPNYATASVSQHVFAMILEQTNHVSAHAHSVYKGRWQRCPDFTYWTHPIRELDGLTMGILGLGRIGTKVARMAQAFGMEVIVHTEDPPKPMPEGMELVSMEELFKRSDFLSLHCPLTAQTEHIINASRLAMMKPTALLVNTARGGLIDEKALAEALKKKQIAGALLDVLTQEPPDKKNPLLTARNCWITPHQSWASRAARERLMAIAVENLRAFLDGHPVNIVNGLDIRARG